MPTTFKIRTTDTAGLIPHSIPIPEGTIEEHIKKVTNDLLYILQRKKP